MAASLDGYIAGPDGEYDWILVDPEIDFEAMYAGFGGIVMGRRSVRGFRSDRWSAGTRAPYLRLLHHAA